MVKRVSSMPHSVRGILILFEIGEADAVTDKIDVVSSHKLLTELTVVVVVVVVQCSDATLPIESVLPPNRFGKLNCFLWKPLSVARCFNKSVKELGFESYLT